METIMGNKIRVVRTIKGISQEYMAIKMGISQSTYCKMESNRISLSNYRLNQISKLLDMNSTQLQYLSAAELSARALK